MIFAVYQQLPTIEKKQCYLVGLPAASLWHQKKSPESLLSPHSDNSLHVYLCNPLHIRDLCYTTRTGLRPLIDFRVQLQQHVQHKSKNCCKYIFTVIKFTHSNKSSQVMLILVQAKSSYLQHFLALKVHTIGIVNSCEIFMPFIDESIFNL